jgi:inner membrane protein
MFLFAHIGITLGSAILISGVVSGARARAAKCSNASLKMVPDNLSEKSKTSIPDFIGLTALSNFLDIRVLMLGSIITDIIDKPLSFLGFGNGVFITHTLLVTLLVLLAGLWMTFVYKKTWMLAIAYGMVTHLILDTLWSFPHTLFWPLYGWNFSYPYHKLLWPQTLDWWSILISNSIVFIFEGAGLVILVGLVWIWWYQKRISNSFLHQRIISPPKV